MITSLFSSAMLEAHYFPLSVALLQRPLQSYILAISITQKQLRYLHHEQCVHAIPFTRIIRISPYTATPTTPSSSHHSQHQHSTSPSHSSTNNTNTATDPSPHHHHTSQPTLDLASHPSLSLTLHVVGSRIGDTDLLHHHTTSNACRDGLLTLLLATVTPDNPPLLPSFYHTSLQPLWSGAATKRGKWGGDAARWMALMGGGRVVLFRKEPVGVGGDGGGGGGGGEPLTCIMLSDVSGIEKKGGKKMRLRGSEREWELGLDSETERDEWWRLLIKEREAIIRRADEWQQEWRDKRTEQQAKREKEAQQEAEAARLALQQEEDEQKQSNTSTPTTPFTPHSTRATPDKPKRKTMPSPAFFVNAQVMAARNKRGSLSIKTRTIHPPTHGLSSLSSSERGGEESKTAGLLSVEGSGHGSPQPWSAVTPRLGPMLLPAGASMSRASTAVVGPSMAGSMQPSPLLSSTSRMGSGVGVGGGNSPSPPAMSYSAGSTLGLPPPSPLMVEDKTRKLSGGGGVGGVRVLDEGSNRRGSMTTW